MNIKSSVLLISTALLVSVVTQGFAHSNRQTGVCLADSKGQHITANVLEEKPDNQHPYIQLIDAQNRLLLAAQTYTLPSFLAIPKDGCFKKPFILSHRKEGYQWFDSTGNKLYNVYWFDSGPDYAQDGLFRFKQNGLIGYANVETYEVVIPAQYRAAQPFQKGQAQVSYAADIKQLDNEHSGWINTDYFIIDRQGQMIEVGKQ